jgi:hypothetical protein
MKLEFFWQIFEKYSNIKFHENPSIGSRVVPGGQTDITKLIVTFRNAANAPKNKRSSVLSRILDTLIPLASEAKCGYVHEFTVVACSRLAIADINFLQFFEFFFLQIFQLPHSHLSHFKTQFQI